MANAGGNLSSTVLGKFVEIVNNSDTLLIVILLATIILVMLFLVMYIVSLRNYLTNADDFFRRRLAEMKRDGMIGNSDCMLIPVIHGKKTIIPLEGGELLHYYQKCQYWFFRLNDKVRNVNIDLLFSEARSIEDFENIGRGKVFITSKMLIFENIRSRNKINWPEVSEIKVKFGYLLLFDPEGCHAFLLENPEIVSELIYNVFLKEV